LANQINVPYISLDQLYWQPDWKETSRDEFRAKVYAALVNNKSGWIIDGNYFSLVEDLLDKEATDIICECFLVAQMATRC
jgi:adenylate kinase family enzyme